jgi:hypothetical protein
MNNKIIFLGWGSLIWKFQKLKIEEWTQTTLKIPLEFSRISQDGRLTLVIDEENGTPNKVWMAKTDYKNIDFAIKALKNREKTLKSSISYINLSKKKYRIKNTPPKIAQEIVMWALENSIDVVIWTDLKSNWTDIKKQPYSTENAIEYFKNVSVPIQMKIFDYIYGAQKIGKIQTTFSRKFLEFIVDYLKDITE